MTRFHDFILCVVILGLVSGFSYAGYRVGNNNGYTAGRLSVYEALMGQAVVNMAALPVKEARR